MQYMALNTSLCMLAAFEHKIYLSIDSIRHHPSIPDAEIR